MSKKLISIKTKKPINLGVLTLKLIKLFLERRRTGLQLEEAEVLISTEKLEGDPNFASQVSILYVNGFNFRVADFTTSPMYLEHWV
jgi:hypothetical protein